MRVKDGEALELSGHLCWYAVRTKARQEERAENNLKAWSVDTYLPKVAEHGNSYSRGQFSLIVKPLFPRYLFARFKADELLHKVHYTRGVESVVCFGGGPLQVDDDIIELLKNQSGTDGYVRIGESLKAGDRVRVLDGPLKNFVGIFEGKVSGRERVAILLTTVSFQSRVLIERQKIKRVA